MNDPVAALVRWGGLAVLAAAVLARPNTGPWVLRIAVLGLAGLAVLPVLGWLRTLWFTPVATAGLAAYVAVVLLHHGQAVPIAVTAGTATGAAAGAATAVLTGRLPAMIRPWVSLLAVFVVWGLVLPQAEASPAPPPLLFGINLAGDRALALTALGLLALGVWLVGNLARSRAGRQIGATGSSPTLARLSGATLQGVWLRAGVVSGVVSGLAGVILAIDVQALPALSQFSPVTAIVWLAVPLIGGPAWVSGVLAGAVVVGGLSAAGLPEPAVAGAGLALAALTRGHGVVGALAEWRS